MADPIAVITLVRPPATAFATLGNIVGGSTPAENVPMYEFDPDTTEFLDFYGQLSSDYSGRGVTVAFKFSMQTDHDEATKEVRWEAAFRRITNDSENITASHTYVSNGVSAAVPSAVGECSFDEIDFDEGADMDSMAAGDPFIMRMHRDHDHADDDASDDAFLWHWSVMIKER